MPIALETFQSLAAATRLSGRDIVVTADGSAELGRVGRFSITASAKDTNVATMAAFRDALKAEYGVFGEHAFDAVLTSRAQTKKSLRASDVRAVMSQLGPLKEQRLMNEVLRQIDTSPDAVALGSAARRGMRELAKAMVPESRQRLNECDTPEKVASLAAIIVRQAIAHVCENGDVQPGEIGRSDLSDPETAQDEPTGLKRLTRSDGANMGRRDASVEDRVKSGAVSVGMRVDLHSENPMLFEKLKTNGVEPGFIFRNDWSRTDTRSLMADIDSEASRNALEDLKGRSDELKAKCDGKPLREQIMLAGRAHPACMAAVAEYILDEAARLAADDSAHGQAARGRDGIGALAGQLRDRLGAEGLAALRASLSGTGDKALLDRVKREFFQAIRDAVVGVRPQNPDGTANGIYAMSPAFRHFADRHIAKLDYNEGDRRVKHAAGSAGSFRLPERVGVKGGAVKGYFYRSFRLTSADEASAGAVAEALANDLTRLAGIPAQELSIMRGKYSDGHPKLMLEAKFANGYHDFDGYCLKDGRIVPPATADGTPVQIEDLGKYKAMFLLLADRDAVGSHGQNKGVVDGKFFAIDPGHSLEGNGADLEIRDNFSFRDRGGGVMQKRFLNFSVFDDSTRFEKFTGVLGIRALRESGRVGQLFADYRRAFSVVGAKPNEEALFRKINARIDAMEAEFNANMDRILDVFGPQLALYDALSASGPAAQAGAIETIENLEKLTSPTTWSSAHGDVKLNHLEVVEQTRIPWGAKVDGGRLVYTSAKPLDAEAQRNLRELLADAPGVVCEIDGRGYATVSVAKDGAEALFGAVAERRVMAQTHAAEFAERHPFDPGRQIQPERMAG